MWTGKTNTLLHEIHDLKKSWNLTDAKIKCRKINVTWKLSDSYYVNN